MYNPYDPFLANSIAQLQASGAAAAAAAAAGLSGLTGISDPRLQNLSAVSPAIRPPPFNNAAGATGLATGAAAGGNVATGTAAAAAAAALPQNHPLSIQAANLAATNPAVYGALPAA